MSAATDQAARIAASVIDVRGLTKRFGDTTVVDHVDMHGPSAARSTASSAPTAAARPPPSACCAGCSRPTRASGTAWATTSARERSAIKREVGYMTQKFGLYEDLIDRARTSISSRACTACAERASASTTRSSDSASSTRADAARRHAVGRLEAAPGAGRLPDARAAAAAARRADGGRRSEGAARVLGPDPRPRGRRHDGAGVTHYMDEAERCHALAYIAYGKLLARGTAGRSDRRARSSMTWDRARAPTRGGCRRAAGHARRRAWSRLRRRAARERRATRAALEAALAPFASDPG